MSLPWISVSPDSPYFVVADQSSWTPIGQNDAIEWPDLHGLYRRRDMPAVRDYFATLAASGVTVLRLMLEYCHHEHRYFEQPAGHFSRNMTRLWDDVFALCEEFGLRVLLTPFDTFWMWRRWARHPYNSANGGPCAQRSRFLLCPETLALVHARLDFVTRRWGASGALFAWDLWNELHPSYAEDSVSSARDFITAVGARLRATEVRLFGRAHLQTVSVFLPLAQERPELAEVIYRHPDLDFASTHFYEEGTIDHPRDTVQAAVSTGKLVREALQNVPPARPFFDSEHGPIHTFKDHHRTLPEDFDDEYFRHIQWAHLASGGAGGAMRWPNRKPHVLTPGMRRAQKSLAGFLPSIDWPHFSRRNWNAELRAPSGVVAFGAGDDRLAVLWLLRTEPLRANGMLDPSAPPVQPEIIIPWTGGAIVARCWDTLRGCAVDAPVLFRAAAGGTALVPPAFQTDLAIALRRV